MKQYIMLRSVLLVFGISMVFNLHSQSPNDIIKIKTPDATYLEHLIKTKLDSVRKTQGISQLANDSGLYVVSKFHCDYLSAANKTSHTQLNDTLQTPTQRLKYFGVKKYLTTELVQSTYAHRPVKIKPNPNERISEKVTFTTYNEVANYFISQWSLNKKTKDDVFNSKFNVIGLAVTINQTNDNIKTVAFLGRPFLKYRFTENKTMFPHSEYQTREKLNSFNEIQKAVIEDRPFKLDLTDKAKCAKCNEMLEGINFDLKISGSKIYVTSENIENIDGFEKFIGSSKNGFMLETIEYEDYHPGNPAYYEKPTRRSKTYIYNGEISDPKFGDLLETGFKAEKRTFKGFLTKNPKVKTYHEFNLYIIYKGMLCGLKRFTSPPGDAMALYNPLKLDYQLDSSYVHETKIDTTLIPFSFEENRFSFNSSTFNAKITENKNYDSKKMVLTITEPLVNYKLDTVLDFDVVASTLISQIKKELPDVAIELIKIPNVALLKKEKELSNLTIKQLNILFEDSLEIEKYMQILESSWDASLEYITHHDNFQDIQSQYVALITKIDTLDAPTKEDMRLATSLHSAMLMEAILYSETLSSSASKIPRFRIPAKTIVANQVAYNYNSLENHSQDTLQHFYEKYLKSIYKGSLAVTTDKVNFLKFSCNHLSKKPFDGLYRSNNLTADLEKLAPSLTTMQNDELTNAYDIKLTYYYSFYSKAASKFESSIENLKKVYGDVDLESKYKLALTLAYYNKMDAVNEIINPYIGQGSNSKDMIVLYNKINQEYIDVFGTIPVSYYETLINSFGNIGKEKWCGQFVGEGNISYQMFDYLPLYHKYCDECAPYSNPGTKITY